jgi:hypothetical protein
VIKGAAGDMAEDDRKSAWIVELRGTITRDIKWVEVEARSMGAAMVAAVAKHPNYRAKSAKEVKH